MKLLDLCSGLGGFSIAAHQIGWQTAAFCERDAFCQKILAKNFPGVPIYDDVYIFPSEPFRGRIDVLTAGFPCQPFSQAGKQIGRDDERHIFPQILEIVASVRPTWCVFENVRGLLAIESGRVFAEIVTSLEGEGFEVITFCIPASALGAPHRRDRLWIVAHANGNGTMGKGRNGSSYNVQRNRTAEIQEWQNIEFGTEFTDRAGVTFANPNNSGRIRRGEQSTDGERAIHTGRGNDRPLSELAEHCGDVADSESTERELAGRTRSGRHGFTDDRGDVTDTCDTGSSRTGGDSQHESSFEQSANGDREENWREPWIEAATRLCTLDDGISRDVVRPKGWRVNALKAAGNSIVPQIAFEIFKAIEAATKKEINNVSNRRNG